MGGVAGFLVFCVSVFSMTQRVFQTYGEWSSVSGLALLQGIYSNVCVFDEQLISDAVVVRPNHMLAASMCSTINIMC